MIDRALREGVDGVLKLPVFKRLSSYRDLPNADVRCRYVKVRGYPFERGESVGRSKWRVCNIKDDGGTSGQAESYGAQTQSKTDLKAIV